MKTFPIHCITKHFIFFHRNKIRYRIKAIEVGILTKYIQEDTLMSPMTFLCYLTTICQFLKSIESTQVEKQASIDNQCSAVSTTFLNGHKMLRKNALKIFLSTITLHQTPKLNTEHM